jgi:hypothetical protein
MHLHRPKALAGWREVSVEIAIIVVGIIIAVGLDQAVEFVHHRHQVDQLEAALQRDGEANRAYIRDDIVHAETILQWAQAEAAAMDRAGPAGPLVLHSIPTANIGSPDAGVWPSARASGVANLLPSSAQNWLEYLSEVSNETFVSSASANGKLATSYAALDQALMGHARATPAGDVMIDAAQRAAVADRLRAVAEAAREVLRKLLIYDAGNDFILSTPLDQLDTPEAGKRYAQIYKAALAAHPAANFIFDRR